MKMGGWKGFMDLLLLVWITSCVRGEHKGRLTIEDILPEDPADYDKMAPPKIDGKPTVVHFRVTVIGLDSIDDDTMTYDADIFFSQSWKDDRIRVPQNLTADYKLLEVDWLNSLWRPDSYFKNAKAVTFQTMTVPNHYMALYKDQTIMYMTKLTLKLSCDMNFVIFPHDTQLCFMQIESFSHTINDVIFQWDSEEPLIIYPNIELPQLALQRSYIGTCSTTYTNGNFTCLEVVFELQRRLGYYVLRTYIPTLLIVIMSWVSFWINPEASPARVTLGVTSSLTLFTQHAKSQSALPPVSYLKAIDVFMSISTIFVFLALMEYCLVNIILSQANSPKYFFQLGKDKSIDEPSGPTARSRIEIARYRALHVDRFSRFLFPVLFAFSNLLYWLILWCML